MDKQIFETKPEIIQDLGTGHSLVHLEIAEVENGFEANVIRVKNPVTRDSVIVAIICAEYDADFREAALRKGISNPLDEDYVAFNEFAEYAKSFAWSLNK